MSYSQSDFNQKDNWLLYNGRCCSGDAVSLLGSSLANPSPADVTLLVNEARANIVSIGGTVTGVEYFNVFDGVDTFVWFSIDYTLDDSTPVANQFTVDASINTTIVFSLNGGSVDAIVYWGDGVMEIIPFGTTASHTYATVGVYVVRIDSKDAIGIGSFTNVNMTSVVLVSEFLTDFEAGNNPIVAIDYENAIALNSMLLNGVALQKFIALPMAFLSVIDLSQCPNLDEVDVTALPDLTLLSISSSPLILGLDLSQNLLLEQLMIDNDVITSLDLSANTALFVVAAANADLDDIIISAGNGWQNLLLNDNRLSVSKVNELLAACVAGAFVGGIFNTVNQTPAAAPTGQGIIDAAALVTDGWTVTTD